jgi:hypothetical protein
LLGVSAIPLALLGIEFVLVGSAVLLGWVKYCREQIPLFALLAAPLYVAAKLPIYVAFLWKRQQQWVRTQRDVAAN